MSTFQFDPKSVDPSKMAASGKTKKATTPTDVNFLDAMSSLKANTKKDKTGGAGGTLGDEGGWSLGNPYNGLAEGEEMDSRFSAPLPSMEGGTSSSENQTIDLSPGFTFGSLEGLKNNPQTTASISAANPALGKTIDPGLISADLYSVASVDITNLRNEWEKVGHMNNSDLQKTGAGKTFLKNVSSLISVLNSLNVKHPDPTYPYSITLLTSILKQFNPMQAASEQTFRDIQGTLGTVDQDIDLAARKSDTLGNNMNQIIDKPKTPMTSHRRVTGGGK